MHLLFLKLHWNLWLSKSWAVSCFCNYTSLSIYNFGQIHHLELYRYQTFPKHFEIFNTYEVKHPAKCMLNISIFSTLYCLVLSLLSIIKIPQHLDVGSTNCKQGNCMVQSLMLLICYLTEIYFSTFRKTDPYTIYLQLIGIVQKFLNERKYD